MAIHAPPRRAAVAAVTNVRRSVKRLGQRTQVVLLEAEVNRKVRGGLGPATRFV